MLIPLLNHEITILWHARVVTVLYTNLEKINDKRDNVTGNGVLKLVKQQKNNNAHTVTRLSQRLTWFSLLTSLMVLTHTTY